ncbi:hypothetical protein VIGAN_06185300 [Vigna angularis var. angularis]|uniref:Uncharacterized protein n=1 Tax=Vigna angularis var. angularis TaxID=157739 RepID=A0A0S3SCS2_PHAAN|nr:hypothetical protein VIGAN_06185300 [Vigna angularis var. angularis]
MISALTSTEAKRRTLSALISKLFDNTFRMFSLISMNGSMKLYEKSRSKVSTFFSAANFIHSVTFQGLPKSMQILSPCMEWHFSDFITCCKRLMKLSHSRIKTLHLVKSPTGSWRKRRVLRELSKSKSPEK